MMENYNQTIINTLWENKISFILFILITTIGYLSLPYLNKVQNNLEKKIKHEDQLLNVNEIKERLNSFDIILDVRSKTDFELGHVDVSNVINIEHTLILKQKDDELLKQNDINKKMTLLIYCSSGNRSSKVVSHLINNLGYSKDNLFLTTETYDTINEEIS
jgi:rhodanese-related sulfurtransferase